MIHKRGDLFHELKNSISKEESIVKEINHLINELEKQDFEGKGMIFSQANSLRNLLKKENEKISKTLNKISLIRPLSKPTPVESDIKTKDKNLLSKSLINKRSFLEKIIPKKKPLYKELDIKKFEKITLERLKEKEKKVIKKKEKKPSAYIGIATKIFSGFSMFLVDKGMFKSLSINLVKANMKFLPKNYVSVIFLTTFLSIIAAIFISVFFLFFNIQSTLPFVTIANEPVLVRLLKVFWVLFIIPIAVFLFMYIFPSLERSSIEGKINRELPFAAINMAAISGSMIDPTKIFSIIVSIKEYPNLEKEFVKIINGVNILGHDLISVLRSNASKSPSKKLAELFNGIATIINTGGDLPKFFDERAKSLLFEYNLEKEKSTRAAETFMDIYISVVIAAPMILMLLLIMMQISGLGISLTTGMITVILISGVSGINIVFLTFLHLRQSKEF